MPHRKQEARRALESKRATAKSEDIVTDFRPFAAFYIITALAVAYGIACFARDMGWLS